IELVDAQVVGAPLHVRGGKGDAERVAQRGNVLEVDLLLEVLGAGRHEHALALEDRRDEVGKRLAGARARLGEQHAAALEDAGDSGRPLALSSPRLEVGHRAGERAVRGEYRVDGLAQGGAAPEGGYSGYRGNFRHRVSTSARTIASERSSSGACRARA